MAVCLSRDDGRLYSQVGPLFRVAALNLSIPKAPAVGVQFAATVRGIATFRTTDVAEFRVAACAGPAIPGSAVVMSGQGRTRTATFTSALAARSAVLCLRRSGRPGAPVGSPFQIATLTYTVAVVGASAVQLSESPPAVEGSAAAVGGAASDSALTSGGGKAPAVGLGSAPLSAVALGVAANISLAGVADFDGRDAVTLRKRSCAGAEIASNGSVVHGGGASRVLITTPLEAHGSVRVCLQRGRSPPAIVGAALQVVALTYALRPAEAVEGVLQLLTVSGVRDFSAEHDLIALRAPHCAAPVYAAVALSGSGPSRSAAFTPPSPVAAVAVCLQRYASPVVQVGPTFPVAPSGTATPTLVDVEDQVLCRDAASRQQYSLAAGTRASRFHCQCREHCELTSETGVQTEALFDQYSSVATLNAFRKTRMQVARSFVSTTANAVYDLDESSEMTFLEGSTASFTGASSFTYGRALWRHTPLH